MKRNNDAFPEGTTAEDIDELCEPPARKYRAYRKISRFDWEREEENADASFDSE